MRDNAPGVRSFDFLYGEWIVRGRRRREPRGDRWIRFDAIHTCWPLLNGLGNVDELVTEDQVVISASLRLLDPLSGRWTIYDLSAENGVAAPSLQGRFRNGIGEFVGQEQHDGGPVRVRERWLYTAAATPIRERALSADGGRSWDVDWTMELARVHWPFERATERMEVRQPIPSLAASFQGSGSER